MGALPDWELKPCGTPAAARRHRRNGQDVCPRCKQAEALASAEFRDSRPDYVAARTAAYRRRYRAARDAGLSSREAKFVACSAARFEQFLAATS